MTAKRLTDGIRKQVLGTTPSCTAECGRVLAKRRQILRSALGDFSFAAVISSDFSAVNSCLY